MTWQREDMAKACRHFKMHCSTSLTADNVQWGSYCRSRRKAIEIYCQNVAKFIANSVNGMSLLLLCLLPLTTAGGVSTTNRPGNFSIQNNATTTKTIGNDSSMTTTLPELGNSTDPQPPDIMTTAPLQIFFGIFYAFIFVVGIAGNVLVCYVVFRNKAMQTVTNYFITNLALSDILLCILAVPFTPLYTFLERWVFGSPLCHIVPYAQGCSVYISTLTLTAVAIDRYFVIVYPFQPRMKLSVCIGIIISIWCFALLVTLPYGLYMRVQTEEVGVSYCEEDWPESMKMKRIFSICTTMLQFAIPFLVITFCYVCVSIKLNDRARAKPGSKTSKREEADRDRKKRTNRMLIAMVAVFGFSWMPLNVYNILADFKVEIETYSLLIFFVTHAVAMSSTCYNPFLYAWLNENFRKEFIQILPCLFRALAPLNGTSSGGGAGPNTGSTRNNHHNRSLRRCLGPTSTYDPDRLNESQQQQPKIGNSGSKESEGEQRLLSCSSSNNNSHSISCSLNKNSKCDNGDKSVCQRQSQQKESMLSGLCSKVAGNVLSKRTRDQQQSDNLSTAHIPLVDPVSSCTSSSCATTTSTISGHHSGKAATMCQLSPQHTTVDTTVVVATYSNGGGNGGVGGGPGSVDVILETHFEEVATVTNCISDAERPLV